MLSRCWMPVGPVGPVGCQSDASWIPVGEVLGRRAGMEEMTGQVETTCEGKQ